ncbi:MAG: hypothetical protein LUQ35_05490 [Methanoregula sp.]|jgi:hypothetical protein|nr:hypothetical protein [Methanoregula sp.]
MKYLLIIVLLGALLTTAGCIRDNHSSSSNFEITNVDATPQTVLSVYDVDFDLKNTASEKKQITTVGVNLYDTNNVFICHGFTSDIVLQPGEKKHVYIACTADIHAFGRPLKEPEITLNEWK